MSKISRKMSNGVNPRLSPIKVLSIFLAAGTLVLGGFFAASFTRAEINGTFTAFQAVANLSAVDDQSAVTATPQANVAAVSAVAQVTTFTPANVEIGDTFAITINGTPYVFTAGTAAVQNVVEGLQPLVDADLAVTCTEDDLKVTCTADSPGTAFAFSSGTTNVDGGINDQSITENTPQENVVAVSAVAQVNTITISGTVEAGDVFTTTVPTDGAVNYTVTGNDTTTDNIAAGLNAAIQAATNYGAQDFISGVSGSVITLTAEVAGAGFTQTSGTTNRTPVAQVVTFTPASVTVGETFRATINGTEYDYTTIDTSVATVVANLAPIIDADSAVACVDTGSTLITCTAESAGTDFTFAATVVDTIAPVITLLGESPVDVEYGSTYADAGATAADNVEGNITGSIITVNPVNTAALGSYTITYNVSDEAGNAATEVTRTVNVVKKTIAVTATGVNKVYDGGTTAEAALSSDDIIGDDEVIFGYTAAFDTKNIGIGKTVSVTGIFITGGADAGNYTLGNTTAATTADITPKQLTVSFTTYANKTYDGDNSANITGRSLDGVIDPEVVGVTGGSASFADKHIGLNKTATATGFTLTGADKDNYEIGTINTTTGNVNPRSITVTAVTDDKIYDGTANSDGTPIITSDFSPPVAAVDTANFTQSYDNKNVGTSKTLTPSGVVDDGNGGNNYSYDFDADTTGVVTKKELTITGLSAAGKTYDGNTNAVVSGTPSLVGDVESDDVSIDGTAVGAFNTPNAGSNTVAVSGLSLAGADAGNYTLAQPVLNAEINKAPLTVTADNQTKVYGAENPELTATITGFVNGETLETSGVTGSAAVSTTATAATGVGTPAVTVTIGMLAATNYDFTAFISGTLAITPASLTVTADDKSKIYGDANPELTASYGGFVNGEDSSVLDTPVSLSTAADETSAVGTYAITASGAADVNYDIGFVAGTLTVAKADATISVNGYAGAYDGNAHGASGTATGVLGEDISGSLNLGDSFTNVPGGTADWTFTGGVNYNDDGGAVDIVINKADAVIDVTSYSATYDGNAHTAVGVATGVSGEDLSADLDLSATTHTDAGDYIGDPWTFTDATGNYNDDDGTVDDAIAKADPTITWADPSNITYGAVLGDTQLNAVSSGDGTPEYAPAAGTLLDAGDGQTLSVTFSETGNYNSATQAVQISIAKADATISVNGYTGAYDGNAHGAGGMATGVLGEDISGSLDLGDSFTNVPGGTATWTFTGGVNYNDDGGEVAIVIDKATATINVAPYAVTYDGASHTVIGSATGVNNEDLAGLDLSATTHTDAGTYNADAWIFTDSAGNYENANGTVDDSISTALLTVTADARTKTYGDTDPELTYQITSGDLVNGDAFTGSLSREVGENVNTYAIGQNDLSAGDNYTITFNGADFTITAKPITVTAVTNTKTYDGTTSAGETPAITGSIVGDDEAEFIETYDTKDVGTGKMLAPSGTVDDGNDGSNYTVTFVTDATGVIAPAPITVTADAQTKGYNADDPELTYQITSGGLMNDDAFTGTLARATGEIIGDYAITQGTLALNSNYDLTFIGADLTIGFNTTITLTQAGQWALLSAPTLLSEAPIVTDDAGGAVALLVYENGVFAAPSASNEDIVKPVSAFFVKTTSTGKVGFKYADITGPTQTSKQLTTGWNLVGTNNSGYVQDEFSSILNTETVAGMVTLYVPDAYNTRKDSNYYTSWGEYADHDLGANNANLISESGWGWNSLSKYDGYWVFMNAAKAFTKNLLSEE